MYFYLDFEDNTPDIQGFLDQVISETNQGKVFKYWEGGDIGLFIKLVPKVL